MVRQASGRIIGALAGRYCDLELAEDAFADACAKAVESWHTHGVPTDPLGWLYRIADRKALDELRRRRSRDRLLGAVAEQPPCVDEITLGDDEIPDERLRLIFICCHPAVSPDARAALTLRLVCGLTVGEIARAFLVSETTLAQRLVRAKHKIAEAGIPFEVPRQDAWNERLEAVLSTIEIAYDRSYEDSAGEGTHADYANEVLELTRALTGMVPEEPAAHALAALVRYAEARRPARVDPEGAMVPISEQDPSRWRRELIDEADSYLKLSWESSFPCSLAIRAAIHGTWCWRRDLAEPPPWGQIAALYEMLLEDRNDVIVRLNRAVALAEIRGAELALLEVEALDTKEMQTFLPYHVVRADLLRRLRRVPEALSAYDRALALGPGRAERIWLERMKAQTGQSRCNATSPAP